MSDLLTFWTPVLITAGINSIIALGLYITMSSGPLSVAHAALAGMGGYLSAVLTTNFGWPFPVAIVAGMTLGFVTGLVLGLLIVRMNELVAGLTTLGFGETMAVIAFNIDYIGGANAFTGIPMRTSLPLVYVVLAVVLLAAWRYDQSRLGFAARATRDSPGTAAAMGINIVWVKSFTFGIGAAIAALGGVLRAHYILVQGPEDMGFFVSVGFLIFVVFGGSYTFWGPLFGGMALTILPELLRFSAKDRFIIYGVLLTVMVIIRPQGLITRVPTGLPKRFGRAAARGNPGVKKERAMKRWTPLLVATIVSMTVPAFSEEKVVHFSSINGQTGQSAAYGSKVIEGVDLAAKAINDAGGFADKCGTRYKLKISTGDMANSREQAVSLLRQAASDASVLAVVGPSPSTGYVPMVPVAGQLKIPIIATGSGAPIKEWNPWAFRLNTVSTVAVPTLMRTLKAKFDVKRVALIYDVTQDGQRGEAELIKNAAKGIGYEVVAFEAFRAGDNDFRPQLSKIKALKPDWIGIYGATPELAKVVNQMAELDIKAETLTGFGTFNDPVAWDLTEGRVKGGYSWSAYFALEDPARPEVGKMVQAYKKEYTRDPTLYSFYGWDAVHVYVEAVKRACTPTDRDKFRQVLNTIHNVPTLSGQATFKNPPDGENLSAAVIVNRTTGRGAFEAVK